MTLTARIFTALLLALAAVVPPADAERPDDGGPAIAIEMRRPPPTPEARERAMRAWHAVYRREIQPVRRALTAVLEALARGRTAGLGNRCRRFGAALAGIDTGAMLPVPDFAVDAHLRRALERLSLAAAACLAGRPAELTHHLDGAAAAFGHAELALRRYGLRP